MPLVCGITLLLILGIILVLLSREEKKFRRNITHGLASKYWVLRERRRFVRFKEEIKIRYDLLNKAPEARSATTSDISRKGLCLIAYEKLREKSYLNLEIELPGFSKPVRLTGQVMWVKELQKHDMQDRRLFNVGIRFFKIDPGAEARLLTHLNNLKAYKA